MDLKKRIKRWIRGGWFLLKSVLWERPRGLDFSLRKPHTQMNTEGNHGYALTPRKSFDNILKQIDINEKDRFIDVGCGKGGCLLYATRYGFARIGGIEIEQDLFETAIRNFERLKITRIEVFNADAVTYEHYDEWNVFFLFNPFSDEIYKLVINNILSTLNENRMDNRAYIICYGGTITDYIRSTNKVRLMKSYMDNIRDSTVNIWMWNKES